MPFSGPKWPICPEQIFFDTNHCYYFHLPVVPFHCEKFKQILTADPELWRCAIFESKMVNFPQTKFSFSIIIILIYLLASFIVQNVKNFFPAHPEFWRCVIFAPKMAHFPKRELFFRKSVNKSCFFHSCLSTCQKSKSDINLLVKYWWFKNTEISLAESHFCL